MACLIALHTFMHTDSFKILTHAILALVPPSLELSSEGDQNLRVLYNIIFWMGQRIDPFGLPYMLTFGHAWNPAAFDATVMWTEIKKTTFAA